MAVGVGFLPLVAIYETKIVAGTKNHFIVYYTKPRLRHTSLLKIDNKNSRISATDLLRATAPSGAEAVLILFLCSLEALDAGIALGIEAYVVAVFASPLVLADYPNATLKGAVGAVEMFSLGKLADHLL